MNSYITFSVEGQVQGVGFRPFVWKLACEMNIRGFVRNSASGVDIVVYADKICAERFQARLCSELPGQACILSIKSQPTAADDLKRLNRLPYHQDTFHIVESKVGQVRTGCAPDMALCDECRAEIHNPAERRYGYAFTNCTNCGPRLSIITGIPYDRSVTTMADFKLCPTCHSEYSTPSDRRFHAQPVACPECGPELLLTDSNNTAVLLNQDEIIEYCAVLLEKGSILAIKGLGGFHLVCDARNERSLSLLRERKSRPDKPLAIMIRDRVQAMSLCDVSDEAWALLSSPEAPIVLLDQTEHCWLPDVIAPGQYRLGLMLPATPLHHLLMSAYPHPLVMTSGNVSGEPQAIDNDEALQTLQGIADYFLLNNRVIANRVDDSVVQSMAVPYMPDAGPGGSPRCWQTVRRARGYAPAAVSLPEGFTHLPAVLAMGGELKNTFCLLRDDQAILSSHMGDMESARSWDQYQQGIDRFMALYQFAPQCIAIDTHPEYLPSKHGVVLAESEGLQLESVLHHHAHLASCLVDNQYPFYGSPVWCLALDGLGMGAEGQLWGGECLSGDYHHCQRHGGLRPLPLPGGAKAMKEPWRNLVALIWQLPKAERASYLAHPALSHKPIELVGQMIDRQLNAPLASSAGRLFDAFAAVLNLFPDRISYEGQAAIALQACAERALAKIDSIRPLEFTLEYKQDRGWQLCPVHALKALYERLFDMPDGIMFSDIASDQKQIEALALAFHLGLAEGLVGMVGRQLSQPSEGRTIADILVLTGGVSQNRLLQQLILRECQLKQPGLQCFVHRQIPANDGGLSLGQAVIAGARLIERGVSKEGDQ